MAETDLVKQVVDALATDPDTFGTAVEHERERLKSEIRTGTLDNPQAIVGMELELYGVDETTGGLVRIPRRLLHYAGFTKELGLHQAEVQTSPQPLNGHGLAAQEAELRAKLSAARSALATEGIQPVSDGLPPTPPRDGSTTDYLSDAADADGVQIAVNMSESVRYHAMSNADYTGYVPRMEFSAPHVSREFDTIIPESMICSIQPHYQVPVAANLPAYFGYALRVAGPLLALGVNSPFFPPDLYDDVPPERILDDAHMEHRIGVFESVFNPRTDHEDKVRFPRDLSTVEEAVDRIADDKTIVPTPDAVEAGGRFDDRWAHLRHKHGSYWRWVRPVFDGATRTEANARIEFRPLPAQPTVRDSVAFLATFAGLMESLTRQKHPVETMDWAVARDNFYAAAHGGLQADLTWITAGGAETTDTDAIYAELFEYAREGLRTRGIGPDEAATYLGPLRARVDARTTPARWKHRRVRNRVGDGADLETAIEHTHEEYVDRQAETLIEGSFVEWIR